MAGKVLERDRGIQKGLEESVGPGSGGGRAGESVVLEGRAIPRVGGSQEWGEEGQAVSRRNKPEIGFI